MLILGANTAFTQRLYYLANAAAAGTAVNVNSSGDIAFGWHLVTATFDGTTYKMYVDGTDLSAADRTPGIGLFTGNSTGVYIGQRGDNIGYTNGILDETRIENVTASSAWVKTEYNNQSSPSTFYKFSSVPSTSYTWDYNNRVSKVTGNGASSSYAYDYTGQRVKVKTATNTTYYPTKFYNYDGTTRYKHIFTPGGTLVADVIGTGSTASVSYVHTDNLTGSSIITNSSDKQIELTDYYPYGEVRLDQNSNGSHINEQRKFTGYEFDQTTSLNYANARYQSGKWGRFMSQDPSFLAIGDNNRFRALTGQNQREQLADPQQLNSYAYARNNPVKNTDPTGNQVVLEAATLPMWAPYAIAGAAALYYAANAIVQNISEMRWVQPQIPTSAQGQPQAQDPGDMIKNMKPNIPNWAKVVAAGILGVVGVTEYYDGYKNQDNSAKDITNGSNTTQSNKNERIGPTNDNRQYIGPANKQNLPNSSQGGSANNGNKNNQPPPSRPAPPPTSQGQGRPQGSSWSRF